MLASADAVALVEGQLLPLFLRERAKLDWIDLWYGWHQEKPVLPRSTTRELRHLVDMARTTWLRLVVDTVMQALYVDGYRSPDRPSDDEPWRVWNANDFDLRQVAVHEAALAFGQCFVTVLPGAPLPVMRGVSPRKMVAVYADPAEDDWPTYAMRVDGAKGQPLKIRLFDDEAVYSLTAAASGDSVTFDEVDGEHGAGVCPVVRYANRLDLDGRTPGEVEPYIPLARRINKTAYDRLMVQHFDSWKVRTVAGMAKPETPADQQQKRLQLRQDDLLVAEDPDTKFGTLDETPLDGFIRAYESDIETLAAVSQTPSYALTGKIANLSADALAAARAALTQKVTQRQKSFGKSHAQALRLAARLAGDTDAADDVMAAVTWQDMEIRSMSQAVDALGKAATMLQIPPQALWPRIPGVTKDDVTEWERLAAEADGMTSLTAMLERQIAGPPAALPAAG